MYKPSVQRWVYGCVCVEMLPEYVCFVCKNCVRCAYTWVHIAYLSCLQCDLA